MTGLIVLGILFLAVGIFDYFIAIKSYKIGTVTGRCFGAVMICSALTTLFYVFNLAAGNYFYMSLFSSLYFICVDFLSLFLLRFVISFIRLDDNRYLRTMWNVFCVVVLGDSFVMLSNPFRETALTYIVVPNTMEHVYHYIPFLMFNLHLGLCYVLIGLSVVFLIIKAIRTPATYLMRYMMVVASILVVVVLNILYLLGKAYFRLDYSILFYSISGILVYLSAFKYSNISIQNKLRHLLMDNIGEPLMFFDYEDRVTNFNRAMEPLFAIHNIDPQELHLNEFTRITGMPSLGSEDQDFDWHYNLAGSNHNYRCTYQCLRDNSDHIICKVLQMSDMTNIKDSVTGLDLLPKLERYLNLANLAIDSPIQLVVLNVNGLGYINEEYGSDRGDQVLSYVADFIKTNVDCRVIVSLDDGNIAFALASTSHSAACDIMAKLSKELSATEINGIRVSIEYGVSEYKHNGSSLNDYLRESLLSMYRKKLISEDSRRNSLIKTLDIILFNNGLVDSFHIQRVIQASINMGRLLKLSDSDVSLLALLAATHEIGKLEVDRDLLLKNTELTEEEHAEVRRYVEKGAAMALLSSELAPVSDLIRHHREWWNQGGYPDGLKGRQIPVLCRIFNIIDCYDTMTHSRAYSNVLSPKAAIEEMLKASGTKFDPDLMIFFEANLDRITGDMIPVLVNQKE